MIVRALNDLIDTSRDVRGEVWASRRFLLADDGVGFDPEKHPPGLGLASIRERARLLDVSVALDTRPGAGTELVIEIPITGPP